MVFGTENLLCSVLPKGRYNNYSLQQGGHFEDLAPYMEPNTTSMKSINAMGVVPQVEGV